VAVVRRRDTSDTSRDELLALLRAERAEIESCASYVP
jgi:hypothetical protein